MVVQDLSNWKRYQIDTGEQKTITIQQWSKQSIKDLLCCTYTIVKFSYSERRRKVVVGGITNKHFNIFEVTKFVFYKNKFHIIYLCYFMLLH